VEAHDHYVLPNLCLAQSLPEIDVRTRTERFIQKLYCRVFEAVNIAEHRVAACKMILLAETTTKEKERRRKCASTHQHILEFLNAVVELKHKAFLESTCRWNMG